MQPTETESARPRADRAADRERAGRPRTPRRSDIQALRALAILGVLINHLSGDALTGGFLGVDVFFVISGFLITGLVARDVSAGMLSLPVFWARRIRRLMPAAFTALAATGVATALIVPRTQWRGFFSEILASAAYVENWFLANGGTDYFAESSATSPVQHFWSLAVEEQYYVVMPLLAAAVGAVAARTSVGAARLLAALLAAVAVASFASAVWMTAQGSPAAYFATTTRAWEFAAGGLAALAARRRWGASEGVRAGAAWLGWIGIASSMVLVTPAVAHPGPVTLIPVAATVLVLARGTTTMRADASRWIATRPVRALGDASYSLYLWHWPVIVLVPYAVAATGASLLLIELGLIAALSAASYRLVEQRYLHPSRARLFTTRRAFVTLIVGSLAVAAVPATAVAHENRVATLAEEQVAAAVTSTEACTSAFAEVPAVDCAPHDPDTVLPPATAADAGERLFIKESDDERCFLPGATAGFATCGIADGGADALRVLVVGDSHARQYLPALRTLASEGGWSLTGAFRQSCTYTFATRSGFDDDVTDHCTAWQEAAATEIADGDYDLVITSGLSGETWDATSGDSDYAGVEGLIDAWQVAVEAGSRVVAIRDDPRMSGGVLGCVDRAGVDAGSQCAVPRDDALAFDPQEQAVEAFAPNEVALVDLSDMYCDDAACSPVADGVLIYRDATHLTPLWAFSLADPLERRILASFVAAG